MKCHWAEKCVEFECKGRIVRLKGKGTPREPADVMEITMQEVLKWHKGNEIWAAVVLEKTSNELEDAVPPKNTTSTE